MQAAPKTLRAAGATAAPPHLLRRKVEARPEEIAGLRQDQPVGVDGAERATRRCFRSSSAARPAPRPLRRWHLIAAGCWRG